MPVDVEVTSQNVELKLPGGACVAVQFPRGAAPVNGLELAKQLMAQGSAALAPTKPVFDIIEAILAVAQFAESVQDSLGPPPDPSALNASLANLAQKVAVLARLIPQLSMPLTVVSFIDVILLFLDGVLAELARLAVEQQRLDNATLLANALNDAPDAVIALLEAIDCGQGILNGLRANLNNSITPMNSLIELINVFGSLAGLPAVAPMEELGPDAVGQVQSSVEALQTVRAAIPV